MILGCIGLALLGVGVVTIAIVEILKYVDTRQKKMPTGRPAGEYDLEAWEEED